MTRDEEYMRDCVEAIRGLLDGSFPVKVGTDVPFPPGEHVVHLVIDATEPKVRP